MIVQHHQIVLTIAEFRFLAAMPHYLVPPQDTASFAEHSRVAALSTPHDRAATTGDTAVA
jgi:hypothetical protein